MTLLERIKESKAYKKTFKEYGPINTVVALFVGAIVAFIVYVGSIILATHFLYDKSEMDSTRKQLEISGALDIAFFKRNKAYSEVDDYSGDVIGKQGYALMCGLSLGIMAGVVLFVKKNK